MERNYSNILAVWNLSGGILGGLLDSLHTFQFPKYSAFNMNYFYNKKAYHNDVIIQ